MKRSQVLVIEDDPAIRTGLVDALAYAGYDVLQAADGREGLSLALESEIDLVLLDVMLPQLSGFDVLDQLHQARPTLPVIMVTARGAEDDRVRGLRHGADDYVTKPFSALELLARVEAVMRRSPERPRDVQVMRTGSLFIDLARQEIRENGCKPRSLTEREAEILRYLAASNGRAVAREELLHRVWGLNPRNLETRTVDMHIARLREKLGGGETIIRTVRGKGYMLGDDVQVEGS